MCAAFRKQKRKGNLNNLYYQWEKQQQTKKTQLIVTRMCNDWLVDEYVPFHWREQQKKNSRIERVIHIQPKRKRRKRENTHC